MNVKYRKWRLGDPVTPKPLNLKRKDIKLGVSDHIAHPTRHAKFGYNRFKGGVAAHARNLQLGVYFFLSHGYRPARWIDRRR